MGTKFFRPHSTNSTADIHPVHLITTRMNKKNKSASIEDKIYFLCKIKNFSHHTAFHVIFPTLSLSENFLSLDSSSGNTPTILHTTFFSASRLCEWMQDCFLVFTCALFKADGKFGKLWKISDKNFFLSHLTRKKEKFIKPA